MSVTNVKLKYDECVKLCWVGASLRWVNFKPRFVRDSGCSDIICLRIDGDWAEVDRLCTKALLKNHKSFLYAAYKQQYLEYIEHHEVQKVCILYSIGAPTRGLILPSDCRRLHISINA